ncbi:MAG: aldose epimerase family protein [Bryocella sp.]
MASLPTSRHFGTLPNGELVELWTLRGDSGLVVEAMTYGGIVTRILLPDGTDVVLGFDDLAPYAAGHPFFGAIAGRVAGRITGAQFTLDGVTTRLAANEGAHNLHGGPVGFDKRIWRATPQVRQDGAPSLQLQLQSADGDQGFPGTVDVTINYTVTADNAFLIESSATTTKPTPISLTQHSYFNLAGQGSDDIRDHTLEVLASRHVPTREDLTLLDRFEPVDATTDLRQPRRLRDAVADFPGRHGALYATEAQGALVPILRLTHPPSGHIMDCFTNAPFLQLYTASHLVGPITGKSGSIYNTYAGICFECESYANAANAPHMDPHGILRPGETQRFSTKYQFSSAAGVR